MERNKENLDQAMDLERLFAKDPMMFSLYQALENRIAEWFPDATIQVQKSQVSFCAPRPFCMAWPPRRRMIPGRPPHYLMVTFGLRHPEDSPRIVQRVEPYPGRWTHHLPVETPEELDAELYQWLFAAYQWKTGKNKTQQTL